jgi:subtilisin family serine protease
VITFHPATAALLTALSLNALALEAPASVAGDTVALEQLSDTAELSAVAVKVVPLPLTTVTTLVKAAPTAAEIKSRSVQPWLTQVNKPYANQLATGNGAGVTVGVVDSGAQVTHTGLAGRFSATYNAFTGSADVTDQIGHGTHVSGIIAGTSANGAITEGIAPGARLVMAKVFATGSSPTSTIEKGINWVVNVQKAPIVSLSLGASSVSMQSSIQNAVSKGTLIAAALGNEGKTNAASWPAEFAKAPWANGQMIAVGALDARNQRASFSNYDPTLSNWTVYAPGVGVVSTYSTPTAQNALASMSGTSMATPVVAGQAALIKSNWNFLVAKDIAQVIFQSATRLCSDGATAAACSARTTSDRMYGWGLVNVGASLQPIGGLNVGTVSGAKVVYTGTTVAPPKAGLAAGLKGLNTVAVDKFNRGFVVNVTGLK